MRRAGLLVLLLASLSLTTAFAASFEVRAEDVTSFSTAVSISVPTTTTTTAPPLPPVGTDPWYLYRAPPAPGGLSTTPEEGGPHKWQVDPSGATTLLAQTDPSKYYVWSSGALPGALSFQNQEVTFNAYLTAGGNSISAALLNCPSGAPLASTTCTILGSGGPGVPSPPNLVVVSLGKVTGLVPVGNELRLKVINTGSQFWQIEWGYKTNRESNLQIAAPSP